MKAMIVNSFGNPNVFEVTEVPKPAVKPGHVLVKIAASSVNTVDTMIRQMGPELPISPSTPAILGMDFAGTVEIDLSTAHFKVLSLHVVFMLIPMLHQYRREEHAKILNALTAIAESGNLRPIIDETDFNLTEIGKAHERLESGKTRGKIVVAIEASD